MANSNSLLDILDQLPRVDEAGTQKEQNPGSLLDIFDQLPMADGTDPKGLSDKAAGFSLQPEIDAIKGIPESIGKLTDTGKFLGNRFLSGGADLLDTVGSMDQVIPPLLGADDDIQGDVPIGVGTRERAQAAKQGLFNALSPEDKRLTDPIVKSTGEGVFDFEFDQELIRNPKAIFGKVMESGPSTIATMFGGAKVAGGVFDILKGMGVSKGKSLAISTGLGFGGAEGVIEGGFTAKQVHDTVMNTKPEMLATAPMYQALIQEGNSPEEAKGKLARTLSQGAGFDSAVVSGALGAPMGLFYGKLFKGLMTGNPIKVGAAGVLGEAAQEFLQEGSSGAIQDLAVNKAGHKTNPLKDFLQQGIEGGIVGGPMGGATVAAAKGAQTFQEPQNTPAGEFQLLIEKLMGEGKVKEGPAVKGQGVDAPPTIERTRPVDQEDIESGLPGSKTLGDTVIKKPGESPKITIRLEQKAKEQSPEKTTEIPQAEPIVKQEVKSEPIAPAIKAEKSPESPGVAGIFKSLTEKAKAQEPPAPKVPKASPQLQTGASGETKFVLPGFASGKGDQKKIRENLEATGQLKPKEADKDEKSDIPPKATVTNAADSSNLKQFHAEQKGFDTPIFQGSDDVGPGTVLKTDLGLHLTPFPKISLSADKRFINKSRKMVDRWLYDNAKKIAEPLREIRHWKKTAIRGKNPESLSPADRDDLNLVLFGDPDGPGRQHIVDPDFSQGQPQPTKAESKDLIITEPRTGKTSTLKVDKDAPGITKTHTRIDLDDKGKVTAKTEQDTKEESRLTGKPVSFAETFKQKMDDGVAPKDNRGVKALLAEQKAKKPSEITAKEMKDAQEDIEEANVLMAREIVRDGLPEKETYNNLVELYNNQPLLTARTSTSVGNQAFSTPLPLAYLSGKLARVAEAGAVYEPTAGHGALLIEATGDALINVNELEKRRIESLKRIPPGKGGLRVTEADATQDGIVPEKSQDSVIMNPPFGGLGKKVKVDGFKIGKLDHLIAAKALATMKDDGRAVMIIGANLGKTMASSDRIFFNWLYSHYNVADHFEMAGKLYNRQGAGFPIRIITIAGRQKSETFAPKGPIFRAESFEELYERFQEGITKSRDIRTSVREGELEVPSERGTTTKYKSPRSSAVRGPDSGAVDSDVGGLEPGAVAKGDIGRSGQGRSAVNQSEQTGDVGRTDDERTDNVTPARGGLGRSPEQKTDSAIETESSKGIPEQRDAPGGIPQPSSERLRPPVRENRETSAGSLQIPYREVGVKGQSTGNSPKVLLPTNQVSPVQRTLEKLVQRYGNLDTFVQNELGYKSKKEMHDALFGIQVDALASAISNAKRGVGMIIADQTGIGKGRQAAAMIRWAKRQGWTPVFVTARAELFTDMHRDLVGIGESLNPLIINGDAEKANVYKKGTDEIIWQVLKPSERKKVIQELSQGTVRKGHDSVFLTYTQVQGKDAKQANALKGIAGNAFFILDESHKAGGAGAANPRAKKGADGKPEVGSNTFRVVKDALKLAKGVTYLSATYAKRPDTIPIYFRTDLSKAFKGSVEKLVESANKGGTPYQNLISAALAESGQLVRRETSFEGIEVETETPDAGTPEGKATIARQEKAVDQAVEGLRAIRLFSEHFLEVEIGVLNDKADASGGRVLGLEAQEKNKVEGINFAAHAHNYIKQLLLGIKVEEVADRAVKAIKSGEKVVIVVENTMESFLDRYAGAKGISVGGSLKDFDWGQVLASALDSTMTIREKDAKGEEVSRRIKETDMTPSGQQLLKDVRQVVESVAVDAPASPIDFIKNRLKESGVKVGEITGRNLTVDYSGKIPKLAKRSKADKEANTTLDNFNGFNKRTLIDAVIINGSAAEGVSMHSSETFPDQKTRRMIVAQPAGDINQYMQLMGRINRTGQVVLPKYTISTAGVPAENRASSILSGKLAKLNASTTANSKSALSFEVADVLNEVGDQIVLEYLNQNPAMARALNVSTPIKAKEAENGFARKITGHVALLPVKLQKKFWDEVTQMFNDEIEYLNSIDQNPLETKFKELDADLVAKSEKVIVHGTRQESAFESDSTISKYSVKKTGVPLSKEKVQEEIDKSLEKHKAENADQYIAGLSEIAEKRAIRLAQDVAATEKDPEKISALVSKIQNMKADTAMNWRRFRIGSVFNMNIEEDSFVGVVVNMAVSGLNDSDSNMFAPSRSKVTFMVNNGFGKISIPLSKILASGDLVESQVFRPNMDAIFNANEEANRREDRYIVTGNLISGFTEVGNKGQIIDFSMKNGDRVQGIIMPRSFDPQEDLRAEPLLRTASEVIEFLDKNQGKIAGIRSDAGDGISDELQIEKIQGDGGIKISVPATRLRGGDIFLDEKLIAITGDFAGTRGGRMGVTVSGAKATAALEYLINEKGVPIHGEVESKNPFKSPFGNESGFINPTAIKQSYTTAANNLFDFLSDKIKPHFGSLGALPEEQSYLVERYKVLGNLAAIDEIAKNLSQVFNGVSEADKQAIFEFMTTKGANIGSISDPKTRADAVRVKKMINAVGKKLVRKGLLAEDVFEEHSGEYLPRLYLKHLVGEKVGFSGSSKVSDLGFLKHRKDIPEDVRRIILGEIRDPGFLSAKGFGKPMRDMAILELLDTIAQRPEWVLPQSAVPWDSREEINKLDPRFSYTRPTTKNGKPRKRKMVSVVWLAEEARRLREQAASMSNDGDRQTALKLADRMDEVSAPAIEPQDTKDFKQVPNTIRYGELKGMWVRREIYDDLFGTANMISDDVSLAQQWVGDGGKLTKATMLWKLSKVALNPPTQIRNIVSNGVLLNLSGVSMTKLPSRVFDAVKQIRNNGPAWKVAKKYGISSTTFSSQEMINIDREFIKLQASEPGVWSQLKSIATIIATKASDFYGASESVFKTAKIIDMMAKGESQETAALEAQKWLFDYSLVPDSVRFLRNSPIGIPFLTFYYKALPRMVEVAVKNPLRLAPYLIAPYLLAEFIANLYDVDDDDLEVLRKALPFWLQNKGNAYFFPFKDEHGRWQAVDIGYFFPWTMYTEMMNEIRRGEVSEFIGTTGLFGGPTLDLASAIKTNIDPFTKREIARKGDTPVNQVVSWMQYLWRMSAPTWLTDIGAANHILKSLDGSVNPRDGRPLLTEMQAALRFIGVNIYPIDPQSSRIKNIRRMEFQISETKRAFRSHARNRNLNQEQLQGVRDEYREFLLKQAEELETYKKESIVNPKLLQE